MRKTYNILSGDVLKKRFPVDIEDEVIVCRESLIEGDIAAEKLSDFFENRAVFLAQNYDTSKEEYYEKSVAEFERIMAIPDGSNVILWFDLDLFCQVNMWFVCHLLFQTRKDLRISWRYFSTEQNNDNNKHEKPFNKFTYTVFKKLATNLHPQEIAVFNEMWGYFKQQNFDLIEVCILELTESKHLFDLIEAISGVILFKSKEHQKGLRKISLETENFAVILRKFNDEYQTSLGLGKQQIKRLYDQILQQNAQ